ncbi:class I SAM-dependent methyltransferase [Moraxella boevrei]|uniref:class I SAM-dependent methyltransferase n=1 Tax=Faucicola boevrei TaxID=346665 RepID=UPI00373707FF
MKVCLLLSNGFDSQNVQQIIYDHQLPIEISVIFTENFDNKNLKLLSTLHPNVPFLFFNQKGQLTLAKVANKEILKISCDWQSYQSRIVKAGKNSELLLKIAKLNREMSVIDATAGFGIDGLILASTGATATFIEKNPILFLLLKTEQHKMSQHKNWQKLMSRIDIKFGDSGEILKHLNKVDLIYLDPMFPNDSYKGAVNKNMQVLHSFVNPPNINDEIELFNTAIKNCDKLIIKRPINAPNFANINPIQSIANDVIRFDEYRLLGVKKCQLM